MSNISEMAKRAATGDNAAFESFYEQTKGGVWFTCINLLKNEENAKDIMQDTYIAAFENLGTLTDFSGVQRWLNKIAANKCKNYIKSKSTSALAEDSEELLENIPDDKILPEEYVLDAAKRKIIMDIIKRSLSEEQYRTIILYYFDEMTAAEIAELMDCHEKTVLYRLKVARAKIKEEVMRYEDQNEDKLRAVVFVPTLTRLFRIEAENTPVPNVPLDLRIPPNTQNIVPSDQATAAVKTGGKAMLNSLKAKIIVGACAVAVVGGGITAGVIIAKNAKPESISATSSGGASLEQSIAHVNAPEPVLSDWEYEEIEGGVSITKYNGNLEYLVVPAKLGGEKVLEIGDGSVWDYVLHDYGEDSDITEIELPDGMTRLGYLAFAQLTKLKTVNIPDSVTSFGDGLFMGCFALESVTFPEGITELNSTFYECTSLSEFKIPESAERLYATFENCGKLTSIVIPENVTNIDAAFENCTGLTEVIFAGNKLPSIGNRTFCGCTALENIALPDGVETIDMYTFCGCTSLKKVTLPAGLEEIRESAFENCTSLTSLAIPDSVTKIDRTAFNGCTSIQVSYKGSVYDYEHLGELYELFN